MYVSGKAVVAKSNTRLLHNQVLEVSQGSISLVYTSSNPLLVANRVPIHQWMWVESTRVGGVHTGGESGLNLSCK